MSPQEKLRNDDAAHAIDEPISLGYPLFEQALTQQKNETQENAETATTAGHIALEHTVERKPEA